MYGAGACDGVGVGVGGSDDGYVCARVNVFEGLWQVNKSADTRTKETHAPRMTERKRKRGRRRREGKGVVFHLTEEKEGRQW